MFRRSGKGFKVAVVLAAALLWAALPAAAAPAQALGDPAARWIGLWESVLAWVTDAWQASSMTAGSTGSACLDSSGMIDPNGCPNTADSDSSSQIDPNGRQ